MNKEVIKGVSLLRTSNYKGKVLENLFNNKFLTPSEIAKLTKIRLNHISNVLKKLKDSKLIICLNEKEKRGRLYQITELGKKVIKENE